MPLLGRRRSRSGFFSPRTLTASASPATKQTSSSSTTTSGQLHQAWQADAFSYYNRMGECWNPAQFYSRAMSRVRLYAAVPDPDEPGEMKELELGWAFDLVQLWKDIPEPYGKLRGLIGEGWLSQSRPPQKPGAEDDGLPPVWEFLSPTELKLTEEKRKVERTDGAGDRRIYENISDVDGAGDPEPGQMRLWRFWKPHPEKSGMADSSFRGVLDLYEQLWWITLSERADLRNRVINQGVVLVPEEIDFEPDDDEEQQQAGDDTEQDPFEKQLHELMTAAIQDPGSAAAASPGVVRGPAEFLNDDVFRHLKFHDPSSSLYISDRERSLIQRIAIGLEMPVEEIQGLGALNHWNAWKLDDEKFRHVEPMGAALATDLTEAVLRPIGRASGKADAETVVVMVDWSGLVSDPDRGKTALDLNKAGAVGVAYLREANNVDEKWEMTPEEKLEWLAIQLRSTDLLGVESSSDPTTEEDPPADMGEPDDDEMDPPDMEAAALRAYQRQVVGFAVRFAITTTGRYVLSRRRSCPDCFDGIDAGPESIVAALGAEKIQQVKLTAADLTARTRDRFYETFAGLSWAPPTEAAAAVEMWFAKNLYENDPDPAELLEILGI